QQYGYHCDLHSFPTRRSSDLPAEKRRSSCAGGFACVSRGWFAFLSSGFTNTTAYVHSAPWWGGRFDCPRRVAQRRASLARWQARSEEHTSELQSRSDLVCRLL